MHQIDQDPGDYRIQRPDGSWTQRVNKPLCRWGAIIGIGFFTWMAIAFQQDGGSISTAVLFGAIGFLVGGLITLSLKSIDW